MNAASFSPATVSLVGRHLIEASAGTGKTHNITFLVVRLIVEQNLSIDRILVVTFTNAATAELRLKVRQRIANALDLLAGKPCGDSDLQIYVDGLADKNAATQRLAHALRHFDEAAVYTIHSFCQRMLQLYAFEAGTSMQATAAGDAPHFATDLASDFWTRLTWPLNEFELRALQQSGLSPSTFAALYHTHLSHPHLRVLPAHPVPFADAVAQHHEAAQRARQCFVADRGAVQDLLETHPGLNHRVYSKRHVPNWLATTAHYLAEDADTHPLSYGVSQAAFATNKPTSAVVRLAASTIRTNAKAGETAPEHPFFDACEALLGAATHLAHAARQQQRVFLDWMRETDARRKKQLGLRTFDDLISLMHEALVDPLRKGQLIAAVQGTFGAVLIDEFQDTDQQQYDIFAALFADERVPFFMIGDPKQSIYRFRGGDIFAYLGAAQQAAHRHSLGTNWRSDPGLICAVNALFARVSDPFQHALISFAPVAPRPSARDSFHPGDTAEKPLHLWHLCGADDSDANENAIDASDGSADDLTFAPAELDKAHILSVVAADVVRLLQDGTRIGDPLRPIAPKDIAVLLRTNAQVAKCCQELSRVGVPAVDASSQSVWHSAAADELYRVLLAVVQPLRAMHLGAALATQLWDKDAAEIAAIVDDEAQRSAWIESFFRLRDLWRTEGFLAMTHALLHQADDAVPRILGRASGERYVTDLHHVIELLHQQSAPRQRDPQALLRFMAQAMNGEADAGDESVLRLESERNAVQVSTIHRSKGLQYPVVLLPYLWHPRFQNNAAPFAVFHDTQQQDAACLDLGSAQFSQSLSAQQDEEEQEDMRLLYVALTRAQHHMRIYWYTKKKGASTPFARLLYGSDPIPERGDVLRDRAHIADFCQSMSGCASWGLLSPPPGTAPRYAPVEAPPQLVSRHAARQFSRPLGLGSFSQLISGEKYDASAAEDGSAADEATVSPAIPPLSVSVSDTAAALFAALPPGAHTGNCLHQIFEEAPFADAQREARWQVVARVLPQYQFDAALTDAVLADIEAVLATPVSLPHGALCLRDLDDAHRVSEQRFSLRADAKGKLQGKDVADALRIDADAVLQQYAAALDEMALKDFGDIFAGIIDLIFVWRDRWYVADYKSNYLGDQVGHYTPARIADAMHHHHYYLQYHLYSAVLDALLERRLPGYQHAQHFGGVCYFFLRGMTPNATGGVFFERPSARRLAALRALFDAPHLRKETP